MLSFPVICLHFWWNFIHEHDTAAAELLAFLSYIDWRAIPHSHLPTVSSEKHMEQTISTLYGY
jgi:hypothetical protein